MTEEDCKRALELSPNEVKVSFQLLKLISYSIHFQPLYFLGNVFLQSKKYSEAISCLSKALYHNAVITVEIFERRLLKRNCGFRTLQILRTPSNGHAIKSTRRRSQSELYKTLNFTRIWRA